MSAIAALRSGQGPQVSQASCISAVADGTSNVGILRKHLPSGDSWPGNAGLATLAWPASIYKDEKLSDHAPLTIEYDIKL